MTTFSVKNFDKFQHYKDRSPPWIKLYNELLDDYDFGRLPDASKMHLIAIWLLASRSANKIPFDPEWVSRRINATEPVNLKLLADSGFILIEQELNCLEQIASNPLADCLSREREEEEGEGEKKKNDDATAPHPDDQEPTPQFRYYRRAKEVLGPTGNGLAAKLLKSKSGVIAHATAALEYASATTDPREYIGRIIQGRGSGAEDMRVRGDAW